ncbi:MAG: TlpA family protein disulfide reductase [Methylococcaceae bacterium]|nr:TlpA family protein disulfide reductase [Methylococcaceae bacterium]
MKLNKILILLVFVLLIIGFWFFTKQSQETAPNGVFTTITGKKIELASLKGNPVIITFWATDCANCIREIPDLINLYHQFHPQGLEIIAITMYYDIPSHVVEMTKAKQLPYDVVLDLDAKHAAAFGEVKLTPTTFLISPNGHIVMHKTGPFKVEKIKQQLKKIIIQG